MPLRSMIAAVAAAAATLVIVGGAAMLMLDGDNRGEARVEAVVLGAGGDAPMSVPPAPMVLPEPLARDHWATGVPACDSLTLTMLEQDGAGATLIPAVNAAQTAALGEPEDVAQLAQDCTKQLDLLQQAGVPIATYPRAGETMTKIAPRALLACASCHSLGEL